MSLKCKKQSIQLKCKKIINLKNYWFYFVVDFMLNSSVLKQKEKTIRKTIQLMNEIYKYYKDHNENPIIYFLYNFKKHLKCEKCP